MLLPYLYSTFEIYNINIWMDYSKAMKRRCGLFFKLKVFVKLEQPYSLNGYIYPFKLKWDSNF